MVLLHDIVQVALKRTSTLRQSGFSCFRSRSALSVAALPSRLTFWGGRSRCVTKALEKRPGPRNLPDPCITATPSLFELRDLPLDPAQNGRVRDGNAAFCHHLDEVPVAEPVSQVPADAQLYSRRIETPTPMDRVAVEGMGNGAVSQKARLSELRL
jgi:hypothetical protein